MCTTCQQARPPPAAPIRQSRPIQQPSQPHQQGGWLSTLRRAAATAALTAAVALSPGDASILAAQAAAPITVSNDAPVLDLAHVVPSRQLEPMQQQLRDLERETGWRLRMLTRYGSEGPSLEQLRAGWSVDEKTLVMLVDPSSPNILQFRFGRGVEAILPRFFFSELQARYGNQFAVRQQGEPALVASTVDALTVCLRRGGCQVVPGLDQDHYYLTLGSSIVGGVIAGAALRLEPAGFVQRRFVWVLLFAPLWGTLYLAFGLGPVLMRTEALEPLLGNTAGFLAAVALVAAAPAMSRASGLQSTDGSDSEGPF